MPVLTKINTNSIAEDAITGDKFAGDAYLANSTTQNISGTYSENRLYTSDAYTLSGNATINSHLTLSTIKSSGDVVLTAGGAYTLTGTGVLSAGSLLAKERSDLTGMTGALGNAVTGKGGLKSQQVFTNNGTWTKPAGITTIKVIVVGGGGGGSGSSYYRQITGGGGQGGGCSIRVMDVTSISSVAVTVGAGGTAGGVTQYDGGAAGGTGGTSSFGAYAVATGGQTGTAYESHQPLPGVGSAGDINFNGGSGNFSYWTYNQPHTGSQYRAGGEGGSSYLGGGGSPATIHITAKDNAGYGAGGGGGWNDGSNSSKGGGAGGQGIVIVEEYS